jgi:hypothetical protein
LVLPRIERHGPIEAWILDDTSFPKKGRHSVGVARQYCGQLGKQDNCQVAVSLSIANHAASLPVAYRLYLPEDWAADPDRRRDAEHQPILVKALAFGLPDDAWQTIAWRGFHHHATLCIAAYGFLISERESIPPSGPRCASAFPKPAVPEGYRPRGSANPAATTHPQLDRHNETTDRRCLGQETVTMSVLRTTDPPNQQTQFMTQ